MDNDRLMDDISCWKMSAILISKRGGVLNKSALIGSLHAQLLQVL